MNAGANMRARERRRLRSRSGRSGRRQTHQNAAHLAAGDPARSIQHFLSAPSSLCRGEPAPRVQAAAQRQRSATLSSTAQSLLSAPQARTARARARACSPEPHGRSRASSALASESARECQQPQGEARRKATPELKNTSFGVARRKQCSPAIRPKSCGNCFPCAVAGLEPTEEAMVWAAGLFFGRCSFSVCTASEHAGVIARAPSGGMQSPVMSLHGSIGGSRTFF